MTQIAKPSIQSLSLQLQFNGNAIATGTGFVYSKGSNHYLITNRHNATGRHQETGKPLSSHAAIPNELMIVHNRKGRLGEWQGKTEKLLGENDTPLW